MPETTFDLAALAAKAPADIFAALGTSGKGLSSEAAAKRLAEYGANEFAGRKKLQPVGIFLSKFKSPLLLLLIAAALVSGFLGSRLEALIILAIVFGSAIIDFVNSYKSARAAEALQEKVTITAGIMRNGTLTERSMRDIVPGDIFSLEAGDLVPADGILLEARDLFLNESVLTGESLPVEKAPATPAEKTLYLGTSVVSGKGTAVAVATGARTKVGTIAGGLKKPDQPTEFERNLKDFSLFIFRTTLILVLAVILINVFILGRASFQVFLFAVAIAVGLTPELLPLIVTSNLAKGALAMSQSGVIVKKLAAIHNFGGVDVLCTDKTGTLTEDRIVLMKSLDEFGKESETTHYWAYVSSQHLTGVRGVLDRAIEHYKTIDVAAWEKVDEVPFDAVRRIESVIVKDKKQSVLIAKGAPEEILKLSHHYGTGTSGKETKKLTASTHEAIMKAYEHLSTNGFRVIGVGIKEVEPRSGPYGIADEKELVFVGFLAFLDPPKSSVKGTLKKMALYNVGIKIITGDNFLVTKKIAEEIGLPVRNPLTGDEIAKLQGKQLAAAVERGNVFTRVNPEQKQAIIRALRENGHVVAYMGDGVNDVLSIKEADVGISVNNAVDIAKETADIILLKKGLGEIIDGIVEGRKTFANTFKYLMMALSSNFGNMFSMPIASIFLPFLPMTAPQILLNNFLYDSSQLAIPFDNVDPQFLQRPKKFDIGFMKKFMVIFGPLSSCFDFVTFGVLLFVLRAAGGAFQTGWFLESIATQTLVVNVIRSRESVWAGGGPSRTLFLATAGAVAVGWGITYSALGVPLGFVKLGALPVVLILVIVAAYLVVVNFAKGYFYRRYGALIEK
ncbi:MAG TPA: magnesium-translocating P-type ATPase [Candidatus Paceibacterota bacterium]|nr:magnesium-translocating P-type ATPase [Candidatus Paceibacterota bacterium]